MLDFRRFECLSFDCYGTLIDWENGMLPVIQGVLRAHDIDVEDRDALNKFAELEAEAESGGYLPYRSILRQVMQGFAREYGIAITGSQQPGRVASRLAAVSRYSARPSRAETTLQAGHHLQYR